MIIILDSGLENSHIHSEKESRQDRCTRERDMYVKVIYRDNFVFSGFGKHQSAFKIRDEPEVLVNYLSMLDRHVFIPCMAI